MDSFDPPYAFLQWKGTDACFDFWCTCGAGGHYDGYFAYYVKCKCGRVWRMPANLIPTLVDDTEDHSPVSLDFD